MKKSQTIYQEYKLQSWPHISVSVPIRPCKEDEGELVWEGGRIVGGGGATTPGWMGAAGEEDGAALIWSAAARQNEREAGDWR